MKKIVLVLFAVIAALFVIITFEKNKFAGEESNQEDTTRPSAEKEKIIKFWEYYRKATDYRLNEQWEQAAENYRYALDLNGTHEDGLYYLGNMYIELSRYKEAKDCFLKLAQVNPKNSRAFLQLGNLYLSSEEFFDIDKAESACRESLKINKEETGPLLLLGEVYLIRGQLEEAGSDFKAVTVSNFKSTEAYFMSGYIAWKKGDLTKANDLFSTAVKYSKPADNSANKVIGEGDTKGGKGFGTVTSKSVFHKFISELPAVQPEQSSQALEKAYNTMDVLLAELKRRVH